MKVGIQMRRNIEITHPILLQALTGQITFAFTLAALTRASNMILMVDEFQIFRNTCEKTPDPHHYQMLLVVKWDVEQGLFFISKHGKDAYVPATEDHLVTFFSYANRVTIFEPQDTGRRQKVNFGPSSTRAQMTTTLGSINPNNVRSKFVQ